jgi:dolichyl-phosphate beta-glucosyltransferase
VPSTKKYPELSVVIPSFNEASRLPATILKAIRWCESNVNSYEVVLVDDGSVDETLNMARALSEYDENVRVIACPHAGKGAAVQMGMLNAAGKWILFMDADGATPLDEIGKLMAKLDEGYAVAIGSRAVSSHGSESVEVKTSLHRKLIGRAFARIVKLFAVKGIADTQCGFKMFRQDVARKLFRAQKINGFAFDVEILYLAQKLGFAIAEVPVNWVNQPGSKVNLILDSVQMLRDVLKVRLLHSPLCGRLFKKHRLVSEQARLWPPATT